MPPIAIIIVDDHEVVRDGYLSRLREQPDMRVVASIGDPQELLPTLERLHADVLMLDISMPNFSATATVKILLARYPNLHILIATMHDQPQLVLGLLDLGVHGYYLKSDPPSMLPEAVRDVASGRVWISRSITETIARRSRFPQPDAELTEREVSVLQLCAEGKSTDEISAMLYISPRTTQTFLSQVFKKLGAKNRADAVMKAASRGLIKPAGGLH